MKKYFTKPEPFLFVIVLILNLSPLFSTYYFTTLDSGSHANNANIIKTLLTKSHSIYTDVYEINSDPVPNWSGHFMLACLNLFFEYSTSEKILISIILIFIPVFFRKIIKLIAPENIMLVYLIFPFTHYVLLYLGFYNFSLGILFFFITLYFYLKNNTAFKWYHYFTLIFLFGSLYFSHLFVFIITLSFIGLHSFVLLLLDKEVSLWIKIKKRVFPIALCSLPFIILVINYFANRPIKPSNEITYLSSDLISDMIFNGDVFLMDSHVERPYSRLFLYLLMFLFSLTFIKGLFSFFKSNNKKEETIRFLKKPGFMFLLFVFLLFSTSFIFPDSDGYGGFIILRFIYFATIFMVLFSLLLKPAGKMFYLLLFFVIGFSFYYLNDFKENNLKFLNNERHHLSKAFEIIATNSSVAPFRLANNDNWLLGHIMEYAGAEKEILVLNNYEAEMKYFPIVFNHKKVTKFNAGDLNIFVGHNKVPKNDSINKSIDYVLIYGNKKENDEYSKILKSIGTKYILVYDSPSVNLLKKL